MPSLYYAYSLFSTRSPARSLNSQKERENSIAQNQTSVCLLVSDRKDLAVGGSQEHRGFGGILDTFYWFKILMPISHRAMKQANTFTITLNKSYTWWVDEAKKKAEFVYVLVRVRLKNARFPCLISILFH